MLEGRVLVPAGENEFTAIIEGLVVVSTVMSELAFDVVVEFVRCVGSPKCFGVVDG